MSFKKQTNGLSLDLLEKKLESIPTKEQENLKGLATEDIGIGFGIDCILAV